MSDIREASIEPGDRRLPGGWPGQLLPFGLLAAGGLWLWTRWEGLPEVLPVHWGIGGSPDRFAPRTVANVALPLFLGAGACLFILLTVLAVRAFAPRTGRHATMRIMLGAQLVVAGTCVGATMLIASSAQQVWPLLVFVGCAVVVLLAFALATTPRLRAEGALRNPASWHGLFYADREDPALFVPKRYGAGYTLNFGRPAAVVIMLLLAALALGGIVAALRAR
jgi:uncharacterized membrane protein